MSGKMRECPELEFVGGLFCLIILVCVFGGCGTLKLHHTDYNDNGSKAWETKVSYWRWFNQSLEGLEIINPLFTAKMDEQNANNDEVTKSVTEGFVTGVGNIVTP